MDVGDIEVDRTEFDARSTRAFVDARPTTSTIVEPIFFFFFFYARTARARPTYVARRLVDDSFARRRSLKDRRDGEMDGWGLVDVEASFDFLSHDSSMSPSPKARKNARTHARAARSRLRDARRPSSVGGRARDTRDAMSSVSSMMSSFSSSTTRVAVVATTRTTRTVAVKPRRARREGRGRVAVVAAAVDGASGSLANEVRASTRDARRCLRAR